MGFRYRVAARPLKPVRRTADLVFRSAMVAVFVDGCFWHRCPDHGTDPQTNSDYWGPKLERNVERDRQTDALLTNAGWLSLNTPMGPEIDGELKREMSLQMLDNRTS
jgi:DNA mismatch endonuclease (patch repair protein)